jgi:hypothetical protein
MDAATHQRIMSDLGLGTEEDRMKAQMQSPGLTIALLTVLRRRELINDEDVEEVHKLAAVVADKLGTFSLSCFKLGLAAEGAISIGLEQAKALAQAAIESGTWLLDDSLGIQEAKKAELRDMLATVRQALEDEEKEEADGSAD